MPCIGSRGGEECLGMDQPVGLIPWGWGQGAVIAGQALDLFGVELRIAILLLIGLQFVLTEHSQLYD